MHTRQTLADDFRRLGVRAGDIVMLHASIRAVGRIAGGPDQIHLALGDVLTAEGTLVMYASCPEHYDEIGRGHLTAEDEKALRANLPAFDPFTARCARENGALAELFRTYPGSTVNAHVARFVVRGRHAAHLIAPQPWDFAYGAGSLLERFERLGGRILLLGADRDTVTFLHYAEHLVEIPDKRIAVFEVPIEADGQRVWRQMKEVDTSDLGAHPHWPARFFARLVDSHLNRTAHSAGLVGDAATVLFEAAPLLEFALGVMKAVAADPDAADRMLG